MDFSQELIILIIRFSFNLFVAFIIIKLIYHRDHQGNDFVFTYFMFNSLIFFFAYLLGNIDINMGFGFGMFAVFAILRYRTNPIPIKEMTYLFIAIAVGFINALSGTTISIHLILFINITLVVLTYLLEIYWQHNALVIRSVENEIIETNDLLKKWHANDFNLSKSLSIINTYFYQRSIEFNYPIRINKTSKFIFFPLDENIPVTCKIIETGKYLKLTRC